MSVDNVVKASFVFGRSTKTRGLHQWDYGQILRFEGLNLPSAYTVHFANQPMSGDAKTQVGGPDGVDIPDEYLTTGLPVYAWVYLHSGADDGETVYSVTIPVTKRPKPTEDEPTPVQQGAIDTAIAALNEGVEQVQGIAWAIPQTIDAALQEAKDSGEFDGPPGRDGTDGLDGRDGTNGVDGYSPTATVTQTSGGATISITDKSGTTTASISNGTNGQDGSPGQNGQDGYSPTASVSKSGTTATITITDKSGTTTAQISDGQNGQNGQNGAPGADGYSPTATVTKSGDTATISITDKNGTTTATVSDGQNGTNGQDGAPGVGVPTGGTTGQVLSKSSGTDYDTEWTTPSGGDVTDVQVNGVSVVSGGVANVPVASGSGVGVVRTDSQYGLDMFGTRITVAQASFDTLKAGTRWYNPVVAYSQHVAAFYGLAKAAGADMASVSGATVGIYPEAQKSAISQMLNSPVTITGSTPTITALPGVRYVCGEVATLDITLPASGCVDITFESGSTPTVLTITPPTGVTLKWANGFDPTSLDANTTYEINVADGLGVAGTWT